jgi:HEAT repeat protein
MNTSLFTGLALVMGVVSPYLATQEEQPARPVQGKPLEYWVQELKNASPLLREEAVLVLGQAGPAAKAAAPALAALLKDEYPSVRVRAALALGKIGAAPPDALPVLLGAWKDGSRALRLEILSTLGAFAEHEQAIPLLADAAADKEQEIQTLGMKMLVQAGPAAIAALTRLLNQPDPSARRQSIHQLALLGSRAEAAIPALTARLKDDDWLTRFSAAEALWRIGGKTTGLAVLIEAADKEDAAVRRTAFTILLQLHPRPKEAVPVFRAALKDSVPLTRIKAADVLLDMGQKGQDLLPIYLDVLENAKDFQSRTMAVHALRRLGPEAKPARKLLLKLLQHPESFSHMLPTLLASLGPESIPELMAIIANPPDNKVLQAHARLQAAHTLGLLGKEALKPARKLAQDADPLVRQAALHTLGLLGAEARDAVPDLIKMLAAGDANARRTVIHCLANIGPTAKDAVPTLVNLVKEKDLSTRREAVRALGRIGAASPAVRAVLIEAARTGSFYDRMAVVEELWKVDPKAKEIIPILKELFQDAKGNKASVCKLVGKLGPSAREFVPELAALLSSPRTFDARAAADALEELGPLAMEAVPALVQALRTNELAVRLTAARILHKLEKEEKAAIAALIDALDSPNFRPSRGMVLTALADFGPKAKEAVPRLQELLRDKVLTVRIFAASALYAIDAEQLAAIRPVLEEAMKVSLTSTSMYAALICGRQTPKTNAPPRWPCRSCRVPLKWIDTPPPWQCGRLDRGPRPPFRR